MFVNRTLLRNDLAFPSPNTNLGRRRMEVHPTDYILSCCSIKRSPYELQESYRYDTERLEGGCELVRLGASFRNLIRNYLTPYVRTKDPFRASWDRFSHLFTIITIIITKYWRLYDAKERHAHATYEQGIKLCWDLKKFRKEITERILLLGRKLIIK